MKSAGYEIYEHVVKLDKWNDALDEYMRSIILETFIYLYSRTRASAYKWWSIRLSYKLSKGFKG